MARIPLTGNARTQASRRPTGTGPQLTTRPAPARQRYYLLDQNATELVVGNKNIRVQDEHRTDGIEMTEKEAAFYIASGTVGTEKPADKPQPEPQGEGEEGEHQPRARARK